MHYWGDDWPYWDDLYKAISEIMHIWKRYGRIGTHGKEKWGKFRDQFWPWNGTITGLLYPGYVRIMTPNWFYWGIDQKLIRPFLLKTRLYKIVIWYQAIVYNYAIQKACKKYPNIVDELVSDLDWYQAVKPGIFGKVDGTEIHNRHWIKVGGNDGSI